MTTATVETRQEPKICAQSLASFASLGILIHFVHEMVTLFGELPTWQVAVGVLVVAATVAVAAAWNKLGRIPRRVLAVVLGVLWAVAASEHLVNLGNGGEGLDFTGVLTFLGGLVLVFAAYWDHHRPYEPSR